MVSGGVPATRGRSPVEAVIDDARALARAGQSVAIAPHLVARCDVEIDGRWVGRIWPVMIIGSVARVDIIAKGADATRIQNIRIEGVQVGPDVVLVPIDQVEVRVDGALVLVQRARRNDEFWRSALVLSQDRPAITGPTQARLK